MALLNGPLQPAWLLGRVYSRWLSELPLDEGWGRAVREAASRGVVVHVVRNVSLVDLLALDHLTQRLDLPRIGFANELGGWLGPEMLRKNPPERLRECVRAGGSAVLFMKRPPNMLARVGPLVPGSPPAPVTRGRSEGADLLRVLIEAQRAGG